MTTARFTSLAVGAAAALLIAGGAGGAAAEYPPGSYPVPTSGWRPG